MIHPELKSLTVFLGRSIVKRNARKQFEGKLQSGVQSIIAYELKLKHNKSVKITSIKISSMGRIVPSDFTVFKPYLPALLTSVRLLEKGETSWTNERAAKSSGHHQ